MRPQPTAARPNAPPPRRRHRARGLSADLARAADPAAIARAPDIRETAEQPAAARLLAELRDRDLLLVLDNWEQVLDAAPLVDDPLAACPAPVILATGRARSFLPARAADLSALTPACRTSPGGMTKKIP